MIEEFTREQLKQYHLESEESIRAYHRWLKNQESALDKNAELKYKPMFSVVVPVYNTATDQLTAAIDSVLAQTYDNFELILVDDHSSWENVVPVLKSYQKNSHIRTVFRETNGHISTATNDGLSIAKGDFIAFMDCDDTLAPEALYCFAKKLNEEPNLDFIYSDEDKITEDGLIRHMPFFKPDWSPDLFMTMNYTNHLSVYRASVVKKTGGLRGDYNGSQDYDFVLRFMEHSDNSRVGHIDRILYHWRERKESVAFAKGAKNYAVEAAMRAKQSCFERRGIAADVEWVNDIEQYRVVYKPSGAHTVSIVIPSKDNPSILKQCIDSIISVTKYKHYEIIVVDNGSTDSNRLILEKYLKECNATYIYEKKDFNFSYMCNSGAKAAKGDYLLFLNDDIELIQPDWLDRMVGMAIQPHAGAVGAKLLYPDGTLIQHAGVSNIKEGPSHSFLRCDDRFSYNFGISKADYDCIAVTGACLLVSKKIFDHVGGFDEKLPVAYNDIDLCFKIYNAGYYNVQRNDVIAYHYESLTRGNDMLNETKMLRLSTERIRLYQKHHGLLGRDPFMNKHLHTYSRDLDLEPVYDKMTIYSLPQNNSDDIIGNIDAVSMTDRIRINGWSMLTDTNSAAAKRYVLIKDCYGICYRAETMPVIRNDVVDTLGNREDAFMCGFETVLPVDSIKPDIIPYKFGFEIIDKNNCSHIKWSEQEYRTDRPKKLRQYSEPETVDKIDISPSELEVRYCIDSIDTLKDGFKIKGFAFLDRNNHYLYRLRIALKDDKESYKVFDVYSDERVDVAIAFSDIHYATETGFVCYISDSFLCKNREYEIALLFENTVDNTRRLIKTGKKIKTSQ